MGTEGTSDELKTEYEINKYAGNNIGNWKSSLEKGEK